MAHESKLQLELEPESRPPTGIKKRSARYLLKLRLKGPSADVEATSFLVHNLSETGVLIETDAELTVDRPLTLHLPGLSPAETRVEWVNGAFYGCSFVEPLSAEAIATILAQAPPDRARPQSGSPQPGETVIASGRFPERLKELRESRGLSIEQLAQQAKVSRQAVWYWEAGRSAPSPVSLRRLARALGVSLEELTLIKPPPLSENRTEVAEFKDWLAASLGVSREAIQIKIEL